MIRKKKVHELSRKDRVLEAIALIVAFVSVYVFFFKIVFF